MTKYLGTIEHNARCFSCLRPDHVDVYDEHVARVDYDALDQQLAEAMDKIRTQGEQYMEMYQLNSDARTRLAEAERLLRQAWTGDQLHWSTWRKWKDEVEAFLRPTVSAIDDRKVSIAPSVAELWVCDCGWKNIDREGVCFACQKPRATSTVEASRNGK